ERVLSAPVGAVGETIMLKLNCLDVGSVSWPVKGPTLAVRPLSWTLNWKLSLPVTFRLGVYFSLPRPISVTETVNGVLAMAVVSLHVSVPLPGSPVMITFSGVLPGGASIGSLKPKSVVRNRYELALAGGALAVVFLAIVCGAAEPCGGSLRSLRSRITVEPLAACTSEVGVKLLFQ